MHLSKSIKLKLLKHSNIQLFSLLVFATSSSIAQANISILTSNIANGTPFNIIDSGFTGQFDLNPYLTPQTDFNVPYQINSAHFDLTFSGANFISQITSTLTGYRFVCQGCIDGPDNTLYQRDLITTKFSPYESANMLIGGNIVASGETKPFDTGNIFTGLISDGTTNNVNTELFIFGPVTHSTTFNYLQTLTYTRTYGYDGTFTLSGDVTDFSSLSNTGLLSFNLAFGGGVNLLSSTLTVDFSPSPVPEPESSAMLLAGLGILGFTMRRRKNLPK